MKNIEEKQHYIDNSDCLWTSFRI